MTSDHTIHSNDLKSWRTTEQLRNKPRRHSHRIDNMGASAAASFDNPGRKIFGMDGVAVQTERRIRSRSVRAVPPSRDWTGLAEVGSDGIAGRVPSDHSAVRARPVQLPVRLVT